MPFNLAGKTGIGPSSSTLRVEPDQVLQLKADLEPIYDEVENFLRTIGRTMGMRPLGSDLVSRETAKAFNENARAAIDAAWGYRDELAGVLDALNRIVRTYNLIEDGNTQKFRQALQ